jgi:Arc/MetJ-type ribon-helix-helix transcriptional regulator
MENANFKITSDDKRFLQQLVASGTYPSLSEIYRIAISEFISKYTDRPTLMGINRRVERNTSEVDKLHEENRAQNERLHDIEEKINVLSK